MPQFISNRFIVDDRAYHVTIDNDDGSDAKFTQGMHSYDELNMSTTYAILEQPKVKTITKISLSQNNLLVVSGNEEEEMCDASLISMSQLVN